METVPSLAGNMCFILQMARGEFSRAVNLTRYGSDQSREDGPVVMVVCDRYLYPRQETSFNLFNIRRICYCILLSVSFISELCFQLFIIPYRWMTPYTSNEYMLYEIGEGYLNMCMQYSVSLVVMNAIVACSYRYELRT